MLWEDVHPHLKPSLGGQKQLGIYEIHKVCKDVVHVMSMITPRSGQGLLAIHSYIRSAFSNDITNSAWISSNNETLAEPIEEFQDWMEGRNNSSMYWHAGKVCSIL